MNTPSPTVPAVKDLEAAHPIASAWRPTLRAVVEALARGDVELRMRPAEVDPLAPGVADQIRDYLSDYPETLVDLDEDTWSTSVSQWMDDHWQILVDLSTAESKVSDLVLHARVFEAGEGFRFVIDSVHVP